MGASHRLPAEMPTPGAGRGDAARNESLLFEYLQNVEEEGTQLYPAQEEAILELYAGKNVVLNTPTGSGKSLVAEAVHFRALGMGLRTTYTSPIKALVNEKFFQLCRLFGPRFVGMTTGDARVNPEAPIQCCTAEILANQALRLGEETPVDEVILDEFHYYADPERGVAWQIPLLTLKRARFLLMSATLGELNQWREYLSALNGRPTALIHSADRPVPLRMHYVETPLAETLKRLVAGGLTPAYVVHFTQRQCAENAQNFMSLDFCSKEEKRRIAQELSGFAFTTPYGKEVQRVLRHGYGIHHGGMLPKYRALVERLAAMGCLKLIFGTDTLGVGVNIPIRTVVFTQLCKYDGHKTTLLNVRDFQQISGRAGRRKFDVQGDVFVQAPAHLIENLQLEQKAQGDAKKQKKIVPRKPPEKNYVSWNRETFLRLSEGKPEALTSRFQVSYAMILGVLNRPHEQGCQALRELIGRCHESAVQKRGLRRSAFKRFRVLVERGLITLNPLRLSPDLQRNFSLHQELSLYLLDTLPQVSASSELDERGRMLAILSLVEAIVENPEPILRRQLDRLKRERMLELKAQGMDFEARVAELEKMEIPKPHREFIYSTFNAFVERHPWFDSAHIYPKSIAREMFEGYLSFNDYVKDYALERMEGVLLKYLSEVYQVWVMTLPPAYRGPTYVELHVFLHSLVHQTDSSLINEWRALGVSSPQRADSSSHIPESLSAHSMTVWTRNQCFRALQALARQDFAEFALIAPPEEPDDLATVAPEEAWREFCADYGETLLLTPEARFPQYCRIQRGTAEDARWMIEQICLDTQKHADWGLRFTLGWRGWEQGQPPAQLSDLELRYRGFGPVAP